MRISGKVVRYSPALKPLWAAQPRSFREVPRKFLPWFVSDILGEKFVTDPKEYFAQTTAGD